MTRLEQLLACFPQSPDAGFDWDEIRRILPRDLMDRLAATPQDPTWHGEGDAAVHTRMVCEALSAMPDYWKQTSECRTALMLAALLHDIGKIPCTRLENGSYTSPNHGSTGAHMARELLWTDFALSGTPRAQQLRETVCTLVRRHMAPVHMLSQEQPEFMLRRLAADGVLLPDFTVEALCLLSEADVRGRRAPDIAELLEAVELCRELAGESGCLNAPAAFADDYTRRAYFRGSNVWPGQSLFDPSWGEAIILSGLPGTGKDTWIAAHAASLPVVSLDNLRRQMGISPLDEQGRVAQAALELARSYLREKQPFVWNATNLTEPMRMKLVTLCEDYGASARIVYLETPWEENMRRNESRTACVPAGAIERMLGKLSPPRVFEARRVEWICV